MRVGRKTSKNVRVKNYRGSSVAEFAAATTGPASAPNQTKPNQPLGASETPKLEKRRDFVP